MFNWTKQVKRKDHLMAARCRQKPLFPNPRFSAGVVTEVIKMMSSPVSWQSQGETSHTKLVKVLFGNWPNTLGTNVKQPWQKVKS